MSHNNPETDPPGPWPIPLTPEQIAGDKFAHALNALGALRRHEKHGRNISDALEELGTTPEGQRAIQEESKSTD